MVFARATARIRHRNTRQSDRAFDYIKKCPRWYFRFYVRRKDVRKKHAKKQKQNNSEEAALR